MNSKNIKRHLNAKMRSWLATIKDEDVKKLVSKNTIISGGAIVSLLAGEPVKDYDVYFKDKETVLAVAKYYSNEWNISHSEDTQAVVKESEDGKIKIFIQSSGVAGEELENPEDCIYDEYSIEECEDSEEIDSSESETDNSDDKLSKYRPIFLSSNAITLSDKFQIVTRFYGTIEEIHKNFDFAHCTCAWSSWDNNLFLPQLALECIINKELYYIGSKYPLCSIIRTRKFIKRGYTINAGQYVKMAMQLNELDLKDVNVLEDQLTGVDTTYFRMMIHLLDEHSSENGRLNVDSSYVFGLINRLF